MSQEEWQGILAQTDLSNTPTEPNLLSLYQQAYIKASNSSADDQFGWSTAMDGDTLVIGTLLAKIGFLNFNPFTAIATPPNSTT